MHPHMKLTAITLDCPDPLVLAAFYQQATGLEPHPESDADFAGLSRDGGIAIGFQRVDDYRPPRWPEQTVPQQFHLDFAVEDLDAAETRLLELGAGKPEHQPGGDRWRVLTDPAGHPFCLVRMRSGSQDETANFCEQLL
ncbi:VOC family protein [Streptomyces malaysiensis]|uniref:VOC family protein n=1 Tax=Streptomyces malaysiensis TaxID=92644 RepID=UPI0036AED1AE